MHRIRLLLVILAGPIRTQGLRALIPGGDPSRVFVAYWSEYVRTWVFWGLTGILVAYVLTDFFKNAYFLESAKQVLAPLFWNMVVVLGLLWVLLASFTFAVGLSRLSTYFFRSSYAILKFASELGALGFGALLGLLCVAFYESSFLEFIDYLKSIVGVVFLGIVFFLNLVVWWVAYCLREEVETPVYFLYMRHRRGLLVVVCIISILGLGLISVNTTPNKKSIQIKTNASVSAALRT